MYGVPQDIIDQIVARRGKLHSIERIDAARSALVVIDMQNYFMHPAFQSACPAARDIVPAIDRAARAVRAIGGRVVWIQTDSTGADQDWSYLHEHVLGPRRSAKRLSDLAKGSEGYALWPELELHASDLKLIKRRYSAFIHGSSPLESELRSRAIDTVLIAGTTTNVCCESTARDAMMLNFKTVMLADALAAPTEEAHVGTLTNCLMYFCDVMNVDELIACMAPQAAAV
jgi:nicotinamidase-related amidase